MHTANVRPRAAARHLAGLACALLALLALGTGCPNTAAPPDDDFVETIYPDGQDVAGEVLENWQGLPLKVLVPEKAGRRPIPLSDVDGKGYNGLLFHSGSGSLVGSPVFEKNNPWRKKAWARIDTYRKGPAKVLVKDAAGNPLAGAHVNIAMYEHEYEFGTAVNNLIHGQGESNAKYQKAASALFNAAVLENQHKWVPFESSPSETAAQYDAAVALGLKKVRGHTLMWDKAFSNNTWEANNSFPKDLFDMVQAGNKSGVDTRIHNHLLAITDAYNGPERKVGEWDAVNEVLWNHTIRDKWGNAVLKDWFDWAREGAGADTKLFINETNLLGLTTTQGYSAERVGQFKTVLDWLLSNNAPFDGIGIQSHFSDYIVTPEDFYNMLDEFAAYGKILKVTEFDMGRQPTDSNPNPAPPEPNYEADFTRDILIACFSHPDTNGYLMWGFWSNAHWTNNAPIFNADWSLKESGRQYIDLVYNKWRSRLSGVTGADGTFSARVYYGDYDITVTAADGKTATAESVHWYKGQNNTTVVIVE
ncbi:MAG: endo-1,4-beta-xylanase [Treponema sp.]|jgi:GH35 family endo-1,4-beta-xylanase|nr:endo-1,4-beta-xylanase [Treponema sp.]